MAVLGPPEIIDAPEASPDPTTASLFQVYPPTDPSGSRWALGGVTWDPPGGCGGATRWAPCSGVVKPVDGPGAPPVFRPYQVVAGYRCSTLGSVEDPGRYARQAEAALTRHASNQAETELWTGGLSLANSWDAPFLADGNAVPINAGALTPWPFGFARLLDGLRGCMGDQRGVIHMAPFVAVLLLRLGLIRHDIATDRFETPFGDVVIAGGGYPGGGDTVNSTYQIDAGTAVGGTFTLTVTDPLSGDVETTAPIASTASTAQVIAALVALSFIDSATGDGGPLPGVVNIQFPGTLAGANVVMTGNGTLLTNGDLTVTQTQVGGSVQPTDFLSTYVYATGPLVTRAGPVEITPTELRDVELHTNTVTVFAERSVLAGFDTCCQFAVRLDLTDDGSTWDVTP